MKMTTYNIVGLIFTAVCIWLSAPGTAAAFEQISSFRADIKIRQDATLSVTEEITYDFGTASRHGIFRDIPVSYNTASGDRRIYIQVQSVLRDGENEPYTTSRRGDTVRVKIGDPDQKIVGEHTYRITYTVRGALNYFDDYDELYWNVTGTQWEAPIAQAQAQIQLPEAFDTGDLRTACYRGQPGSDQSCAGLSIGTKAGSTTVSASSSQLSAREGLTVAVGFPSGFVQEPNWWQKAVGWLMSHAVVFLPVLALLVMLYLWYTRGRDPEGRGVIMARYEPPEGMRPTLVGSLIDEKVHDRDISAGIIYLAQQGFVTLKRHEEKKLVFFDSVDYELTLQTDIEKIRTQTEKDIAGILFGKNAEEGESVHISDMKHDTSVAEKIRQLKQDVSEKLATAGYFTKNPRQTKAAYLIGGFVVVWGGLFFGGMFFGLSPVGVVALIISGLIIAGFGYLMPKKTKAGAVAKEHLLGFKRFITMTQQERMQFHNAPERTPDEFMQYLPYAIAMEVEDEWAKQFADMYIETPNWYHGSVSGSVAATVFADDLSAATSGISSGVQSAAASGSSGSGGGGFSGGGMGGGGGGSW